MKLETKLKRIAKEISLALKEIPGIRAVAISGSLADGNVDKYSDVNLVCICSKVPKPETRSKKILEHFEYVSFKNDLVPDWRIKEQDFLFLNGKNVDVVYKKYSHYNKLIDSISKNEFIDRSIFREVISCVFNTRVLHDPKKILNRWKKKIKNPTPQLLRYFLPGFEKIDMNGEWPYSGLNELLERKNYYYVDSLINHELENFLICLYAINNKHFSSYRWATYNIKEFKIKPNNAGRRIQNIAKLGNTKKEVKKKIGLIKELSADFTRLLLKKKIFGVLH